MCIRDRVLALEPSVDFPSESKTESGEKGSVEFQDVSFRYGRTSRAVIEHVTFSAQKGQTVAFIGSTGSGKSTLVNLIPRFYDATEGKILVDGAVSYTHLHRRVWRHQLALRP